MKSERTQRGEGGRQRAGRHWRGFRQLHQEEGEALWREKKKEKKKSQQTREAVNEGVMKPCRWGQVIYYE